MKLSICQSILLKLQYLWLPCRHLFLRKQTASDDLNVNADDTEDAIDKQKQNKNKKNIFIPLLENNKPSQEVPGHFEYQDLWAQNKSPTYIIVEKNSEETKQNKTRKQTSSLKSKINEKTDCTWNAVGTQSVQNP